LLAFHFFFFFSFAFVAPFLYSFTPRRIPLSIPGERRARGGADKPRGE